jgi:hypothetical protein
VSEQDILDMISTLDANKAVGPDIISNKMLIAVKVQISKPLCMLFNKSLHQNIFALLSTQCRKLYLYRQALHLYIAYCLKLVKFYDITLQVDG